ncbi:MAG: RNA methyltransferase [Thermincola sp.]|jgi:TrmH family RNA methyltransferase|nr:RNA methyltransferase [Thermincola sp.]MDT3702710.1 RNA methyltransferase [Thermincola sp.]
MDLIITSRQNSLVKYIRSLRDKKIREQEGRFLIEGFNFVSEALASGIVLEKLIISERAKKNLSTAELIRHIGSPESIVRVSDSVMEYMSETETPQGVMALLKIAEVPLTSLQVQLTSVFIILDGIQDPGNVGTVIRTADAFGAAGVILTKGCADIYNAKTLRSTMGSVFHLPVLRDIAAAEVVQFLQSQGVNIAVTCLEPEALPVEDSNILFPLALVFGSEARGVSDEMRQAGDWLIKVPMAGRAESLNVAVAAGIMIYEASRRLRSKPK